MTRVQYTPSYRGSTGSAQARPGDNRNLLIVDDDTVYLQRLSRAMERRGFAVEAVAGVAQASRLINDHVPDLALIDVRLKDGSGLEIVADLHVVNPEATIIVLTGYGSIANAVAAIKAGAVGYLPKSSEIDDIVEALLDPDSLNRPSIPAKPMSDNLVRWEYLNRVFELCDRNLSKTARRLQAHRRSLQRLLKRHAPH